MRDLRAEDFVILVGVFYCTIMMGIELVCSQIKTNQTKRQDAAVTVRERSSCRTRDLLLLRS